MGRIAHLKVTCPLCGKYTSIYVQESGSTTAKVKCEHCRKVFDFGSGMMYEPVAYVPSVPQWAVISASEAESAPAQVEACKKCGFKYSTFETEMSRVQTSTLDLSNPVIRKVVGLKSLLKCGNCGAIACSDCAEESSGIVKMRCPFCHTDYTIYSLIKPTAPGTSGGSSTQAQPAQAGASGAPKDQKSSRFPHTLGILLTLLGIIAGAIAATDWQPGDNITPLFIVGGVLVLSGILVLAFTKRKAA